MGWATNSRGGYQYHYVLNGEDSDHTQPRSNGSESIPVCVVICKQNTYTAYDPAGNKQNLGGWARVFHSHTDWKVLNARVQLVRYYAASSAKVSLALDLPSREGRIPPPGLVWNSGSAELSANRYNLEGIEGLPYTQELRPEMDIEIWMGYIGNFEGVGAYIIKDGSFSYKCNPEKFTKVFTGVIDTVDLKLGRGENQVDGINCIITARDKMRYLIDNKIFGGISLPNGQTFYSPEGISRTKIIQTLIKQGSAGGCAAASDPMFHPSGRTPMVFYNRDAAGMSASPNTSNFLMSGTIPFQLMDQFPVDAIRWFSTIETMPRELFCDPNTGDIAWACRMKGEPYKTTKEAALFKEIDVPVNPSSDFNDLWKSIIEANFASSRDKPESRFTPDIARDCAREVIEAFQTVLSKYKYLDIPTFCAMIDYESGWNPLNINPTSGATGLGQIVKNSLPRKFSSIDEIKDPVKNIEATAIILAEKAEYKIPGVNKTVLQLVADNKLSKEDAQLITYTMYNGNASSTYERSVRVVVQAILNEGKRVTYSEVSKRIGPNVSGDPNNYIYGQKIKEQRTNNARWRKFYEGAVKGLAATTIVKAGSKVSEIGVLRGVDNPWILSYKRTIRRNGVTIKPNLLSGKSSWSTLGVITRFSLINPIVKEGNAGGGGIRGSQSIWAFNPTGASGLTMSQAYGTTNHPTDANLPKSETAENLKKRIRAFSELTKAQEEQLKAKKENIEDPNLLYLQGPTDLSLPYKYLTKIRFPVRNRFVWDETADSSIGDAAVDLILDSMMHIHGQDIHAVDFMVPLNPDMRPSHIVELYNMGFFDGEQMRVEGVIHTFASGGVQNGCTTTGVAISTQGSYDPRELPEIINNILQIQNGALDIPSDNNNFLDSDNVPLSLYTSTLIFNDISPDTMPNLNKLNSATKYLKTITTNSSDIDLAEDAPQQVVNAWSQLKVKYELLQVYNTQLLVAYKHYAFIHLCWGLGSINVSDSRSTGRFNKSYGIDLKKAKNELQTITNRIAKVGNLLKSILTILESNTNYLILNDENELGDTTLTPIFTKLKEHIYNLQRADNTPFADFVADDSNQAFINFLSKNSSIINQRHSYKYVSPRGLLNNTQVDFLQSKYLLNTIIKDFAKNRSVLDNYINSTLVKVESKSCLEDISVAINYDADQIIIQKYTTLILIKAVLLDGQNNAYTLAEKSVYVEPIQVVNNKIRELLPQVEQKVAQLQTAAESSSTTVSELPSSVRPPLPFT